MNNKLTPKELEIMEAIWTAHAFLNRLLFKRDILRFDGGLSPSTLTNALNTLEYKKYIRFEQPQGMSRGYLPLISREEYERRRAVPPAVIPPANENEEKILPSSEFAVLSALWDAEEACGRPVCSKELLHGTDLSGRWELTTILTFLVRLGNKGFVTYEKVGRYKCFSAAVSRREYQKKALKVFLDRVMLGNRVALARLLIDEMSGEELSAAKNILTDGT